MRPVLYMFVNKSLGMSGGKIAAQAAQAAVGATSISDKKLLDDWWGLGGHHTTYVLEARDEEHIYNIERYLEDRGFDSFVMIDEGMTEVDNLTATALAVEIVDKDDPHVAATFMSFKLYRDTVRVTLEFER